MCVCVVLSAGRKQTGQSALVRAVVTVPWLLALAMVAALRTKTRPLRSSREQWQVPPARRQETPTEKPGRPFLGAPADLLPVKPR